jgi:hypothetical protein
MLKSVTSKQLRRGVFIPETITQTRIHVGYRVNIQLSISIVIVVSTTA